MLPDVFDWLGIVLERGWASWTFFSVAFCVDSIV